MSESPQQYQARILSLGDHGNPLAVLASTSSKLRAMAARDAPEVLSRRPAPGQWSAHEIIVHLADAEVAFAYRLRMMISTPGVAIQAFDQNAWASSMQYERLDLAAALDRFDALRCSNLELIANLEDPDKAYGIHEERGRESAALFVRLYAGHDINHLTRIREILDS